MATMGNKYVIDIENTGEEIATSSLNMTFASAVPKRDRIKI